MVCSAAGRLLPGARLGGILAALLPRGSMTGVPEPRASAIIRELGLWPRGANRGAIGWMEPDESAFLNVAIRTFALHPDGRTVLNAGGRIVADRQGHERIRGGPVESAIRPSLPRDFRLIETFAWRRNPGFLNLEAHLARLERGARLFQLDFDRERVDAALDEVGRGAVPLRVRLTLGRHGQIEALGSAFTQGPPIWNAAVARDRLDPADPWLRVKSSQRGLYDRARANLGPDIHEMIFLNHRGEVCEGTIFNVFLKLGDQLLTPRLSCGLLPGVLRESLLRSGRAREAVLRLEDLDRGTLMLGNSLRGLCPARLIRPAATLARI